jgi:hypothetical protein
MPGINIGQILSSKKKKGVKIPMEILTPLSGRRLMNEFLLPGFDFIYCVFAGVNLNE